MKAVGMEIDGLMTAGIFAETTDIPERCNTRRRYVVVFVVQWFS